MPNIPAIRIGNTEYDIKDTVARDGVTELTNRVDELNAMNSDGETVVFDPGWETGDISTSDGSEVARDDFVRSRFIPVEYVAGRKFTLNGAYTLYCINYGNGRAYINSAQYSTDGYFMLNVGSTVKFVRLTLKKAFKNSLQISGFDEMPAPWKLQKIDVDQFKDIESNVIYYREHIGVRGEGRNIVSKLIYTLNVSSRTASRYILDCDAVYGYAANAYFRAYQYDSNGNEISVHQNVTQGDPLILDVANNADHIDFYLRPAYGVPLPSDYADYYGVRIYGTDEEGYILKGRTNKVIYDSSASGGFTIPTYYTNNSYLKNKVARINAVYDACAANGDAFIVISDAHWEHPLKNQHNSPSLINYIYRNTNVQRLFDLGDTADQGSQDYADQLRRAFGGKIYHVTGNHEYIYSSSTREHELYSMWDAYNDDQIGNNIRHYYYVDNPQQKLRYVILNAFTPSDGPEDGSANPGYESEQIQWMSNVAFNVEAGWQIIIFTHGLWTFNSTGTNMYVSSNNNAQAVIDAIDAYNGNGEIIGIFLGHEHLDRMTRTPIKGVPAFIQACDANLITQEYKEDPRTAGTRGEQAFDVAILNKTTRTWRLIRIGMKAHDGYTATVGPSAWGDQVEERTLTF